MASSGSTGRNYRVLARGLVNEERYQTKLFSSVEALRRATDEPLILGQMTKATGRTSEMLEGTLKSIEREYDSDGSGVQRGFQLRHVAGGWLLYTRSEHAEAITA